MTLRDWMALELGTMQRFQAWWERQRQMAPEGSELSQYFPDEMGAGDWDEQYAFWCEGDAGQGEQP